MEYCFLVQQLHQRKATCFAEMVEKLHVQKYQIVGCYQHDLFRLRDVL